MNHTAKAISFSDATTREGGRKAYGVTLVFSSALCISYLLYKTVSNGFSGYFPVIVPISVIFFHLVWSGVSRNPITANKNGIILVISFICISLISVMLNPVVDEFTVKKILIPASAMLVGAILTSVNHRVILYLCVILFFIEVLFPGEKGIVFSVNLFSTSGGVESVLSLAMGAIAVAFMAVGREARSAISFILCVLMFKRNAIFSSFLIILPLYLKHRLDFNINAKVVRIVVHVVFLTLLLLSINIYNILLYTSSIFPGIDFNHVFTGRFYVYRYIAESIQEFSYIQWMFGNGAGSIERTINIGTGFSESITLAHNEYLSMVYDYGIVGICVIYFAMYRFFAKSESGLFVLLYLLIIFFVENVLFISYPFMLIIASAMLAKRIENPHPA